MSQRRKEKPRRMGPAATLRRSARAELRAVMENPRRLILPMEPEEFREMRVTLGLTIAETAEVLDSTVQLVYGYERGDYPVASAKAALLRVLALLRMARCPL